MGKWIIAIALVLMSCSLAVAKDVTIKGIPDEIKDETVYEWCSVLIERAENYKANNIPEVKIAVENAQTNIDTFRKANSLQEKFNKEKSDGEISN